MSRRDAFYFGGECSLLLFACAGAVGAFHVWRNGTEKLTDYSVAVGVPATASIALILAAVLVPSLVEPGRLRFPLNVTLPIAYLPLMLASLVLWTTNRGSIQATPDILKPATMWASPSLLALAFGTQIVFLTVMASPRERDPDESIAEP